MVALDITDAQQIHAAVGAALERFGRIDVLVNNAGYGQLGVFEQTTDADVRAQYETNVFGMMAVTRAVAAADARAAMTAESSPSPRRRPQGRVSAAQI